MKLLAAHHTSVLLQQVLRNADVHTLCRIQYIVIRPVSAYYNELHTSRPTVIVWLVPPCLTLQ